MAAAVISQCQNIHSSQQHTGGGHQAGEHSAVGITADARVRFGTPKLMRVLYPLQVTAAKRDIMKQYEHCSSTWVRNACVCPDHAAWFVIPHVHLV
jgi:hypothetical protein